MAIYTYAKEYKTRKRKILIFFSYFSLIVGSLLLFWSFYPIISFEIYSRFFIKNKINSPIPALSKVTALQKAKSIMGENGSIFSGNLRDFTQARLWFPIKPQSKGTFKSNVKEYSLSIPKLNIKDAKVVVGGEDLSKSLIHYLPQSLPGGYGNVVIFGHSTLPQLYNPKNYKTIFTYLPSLEKGDKVIVNFEGIDYEYKVYDMFVVKPDQISVLDQMDDASYLTLITCVPPGTYWSRLIVRLKLVALPVK